MRQENNKAILPPLLPLLVLHCIALQFIAVALYRVVDRINARVFGSAVISLFLDFTSLCCNQFNPIQFNLNVLSTVEQHIRVALQYRRRSSSSSTGNGCTSTSLSSSRKRSEKNNSDKRFCLRFVCLFACFCCFMLCFLFVPPFGAHIIGVIGMEWNGMDTDIRSEGACAVRDCIQSGAKACHRLLERSDPGLSANERQHTVLIITHLLCCVLYCFVLFLCLFVSSILVIIIASLVGSCGCVRYRRL